ncbi:testis-specific Y-encoded protein 3-like [Zalophus californianus]|uniref:Testis-specific Y-encoded protein 3-like n=1 Tax=Zalophus californianus TaxID=9704 RepID=A0A6P9F783_ZALCA|nr:testis-specific Y-encoded protein 3-like [Zalophus californianus]
MAAAAVREREERWESEDAILVEELVLVVGDLRLVLQLAVLEGEDGEDEEATEEAAEEVDEADTEEEDESRERLRWRRLRRSMLERQRKRRLGSARALRRERRLKGLRRRLSMSTRGKRAEGGRGAQEVQEKRKGEEQPEGRRGPIPSSLEALEALQSELERMKKQASRSYSGLRLRFCRRRQRPLEHRSALIRGIPGFWAKAFVNHPQMSAVIRKQDEGHPGYMTDLKVEELRFPRDCRKILVFFRKNPYFRDEVVVKEYVLSAAGYGPAHCTPIQWHQDYEQEAYSRRHHNTSLNSFKWFSDHSFAGSSTIAEIIMEDLWPNPLQYYVRKKAPGEGTERMTGP